MLLGAASVLVAQRAQLAARAVVRGDLADPRLDVHVPADRLPVRPAARQGARRRCRARCRTSSCCPTCASRCFPVVDYKTFRRNYYDDDAVPDLPDRRRLDGARRHPPDPLPVRLLLPDARAVGGARTRATSRSTCVANFLLYLRVSGQFHLIVGHAAPVRLPPARDAPPVLSGVELHRLLAADQHLLEGLHAEGLLLPGVFPAAPARERPRRWSLATLFVFLMTWFLHAYQWFWLRGTLLLVWQDMLFWAILGGAGRRQFALRGEARPAADACAAAAADWRSCSALGAEDVAHVHVHLRPVVVLDERIDRRVAVAVDACVGAKLTADARSVTVAARRGRRRGGATAGRQRAVRNARQLQAPGAALSRRDADLARRAARRSASSVCTRASDPTVATFIHSLRSGRLSRLDNATLERGYYENLLRREPLQLPALGGLREAAGQLARRSRAARLKRYIGGFAQTELIPSFVARHELRADQHQPLGHARPGLRARSPRPGRIRIALLGPSNVMGWGVATARRSKRCSRAA